MTGGRSTLIAASLVAQLLPLGIRRPPPEPRDNQGTPESIALGRSLFQDPRLSRNGSIACATCHIPKLGFSDSRPTAVGIDGRRGLRKVQTLIGRGFGKEFFWDGRATTLEQQVLMPIRNPNEMDLEPELAAARGEIDRY